MIIYAGILAVSLMAGCGASSKTGYGDEEEIAGEVAEDADGDDEEEFVDYLEESPELDRHEDEGDAIEYDEKIFDEELPEPELWDEVDYDLSDVVCEQQCEDSDEAEESRENEIPLNCYNVVADYTAGGYNDVSLSGAYAFVTKDDGVMTAVKIGVQGERPREILSGVKLTYVPYEGRLLVLTARGYLELWDVSKDDFEKITDYDCDGDGCIGVCVAGNRITWAERAGDKLILSSAIVENDAFRFIGESDPHDAAKSAPNPIMWPPTPDYMESYSKTVFCAENGKTAVSELINGFSPGFAVRISGTWQFTVFDASNAEAIKTGKKLFYFSRWGGVDGGAGGSTSVWMNDDYALVDYNICQCYTMLGPCNCDKDRAVIDMNDPAHAIISHPDAFDGEMWDWNGDAVWGMKGDTIARYDFSDKTTFKKAAEFKAREGIAKKSVSGDRVAMAVNNYGLQIADVKADGSASLSAETRLDWPFGKPKQLYRYANMVWVLSDNGGLYAFSPANPRDDYEPLTTYMTSFWPSHAIFEGGKVYLVGHETDFIKLLILDLSDPFNPYPLFSGEIERPGGLSWNYAGGAALIGDTLYVAQNMLTAIDVSDSTSPKVLWAKSPGALKLNYDNLEFESLILKKSDEIKKGHRYS